MTVREYIDHLKNSPAFMKNVTSWRVLPERAAKYGAFPENLHPGVLAALQKKGIERPYIHQAKAIACALEGKDLVVVTPTASGKTLCYNVPVLDAILKDESARALYLFPTKALSSDQAAELYSMIESIDCPIKAYTYDGDTPASARSAIRQAGHVVVTNPDMLHQGILPHHAKWIKLFENLRYVVIDEIHAYRGVFGSNLANVIRRLKRICAFYGSDPVFICCSATIRNPKELAESMTGKQMVLVDENGAPAGERNVIFYNPPVVNAQLGIRAGSIPETRNIAASLLKAGVQSIVFARARLTVEVLVRYLKDMVRDPLGNAGQVRGYRGGYLPTQRREIERELRAGNVMTVVSTNALELGIDIGQLDACVMCGYPGSIASTWQEAGRAGRRKNTALTVVVASSSALDQYVVTHPAYFFGRSPENALVHPDNLYVLLNHVKCAAYELPFEEGEQYADGVSTQELLNYLCEEQILNLTGGRYYWMAEEFPAADLSLRSVTSENFVIIDITNPAHHNVIGEMDRYTVPMLLHEHAIYMHEGQQFQVEKLDFTEKKAYVRSVNVDYYTDADLNTSVKVLDVLKEQPLGTGTMAYGEVLVTWLVTMFKKFKLNTQETLGFGPVDLPELEMPTNACWWALDERLTGGLSMDDLQGGMLGIANALRQIIPLYLMCSPSDICVQYRVRDPFTKLPTIIVFDNYAGGIGLSERVYGMRSLIFGDVHSLIRACPCESGCPSCVGPRAEVGERGKQTALLLTERLMAL